LSPSTELLETGIKVIDLICPFAKGGKIGLFGGAGVRQDGHDDGAHQQHRDGALGPVGVRRRGRAHARRQRLLPRDDRIGVVEQGRARQIEGRDGVRPDERAAGQSACASR
jgi:hypothetical protein